MRRYEATPEDTKAELIDGIVYMASPVRMDTHGDQDNLMQCLLGMYSFATPGVRASSNATTLLGEKDIPQPDISMRYTPERTGEPEVNEKGYLIHAPEMIVEIAFSSLLLDLGEKLKGYLRAGIPEYIVWGTRDPDFKWFVLENGRYVPLQPGKDGILRSRVFPGFWIDPKALLADDRARVKAVLEMGLRSAEHKAFAKL